MGLMIVCACVCEFFIILLAHSSLYVCARARADLVGKCGVCVKCVRNGSKVYAQVHDLVWYLSICLTHHHHARAQTLWVLTGKPSS